VDGVRDMKEFKRDRYGINLNDPHNAKIIRKMVEQGPPPGDYDRKMRRAYRRDHPGEEPLPEHLCALDHPYPGWKRWAARAKRWMDNYERKRTPW
jgi:hypothetical protein